MITTVTLNAAIDKTYSVPAFTLERVNRIQQVVTEAGGKGINVAKVLKRLGLPVKATGVIGGFNGQFICQQLDDLGIDHEFIRIKEESRLCLNIIDPKFGSQTEILEPGPVITASEWKSIQEELIKITEKSLYIIFSGSLPRGLPEDAYAQLIKMVQKTGVKVVLDTSGPVLKASLSAKPYMIKPNREELAALLNKRTVSDDDILETVQQWGKQGISLSVVSLGKDGAIVFCDGTAFKVLPPVIEPVNPVGSGDSFVAGMVAGLYLGYDMAKTIELATAAAAANALEQKAGNVDLNKVEALKKEVKIKKFVL